MVRFVTLARARSLELETVRADNIAPWERGLFLVQLATIVLPLNLPLQKASARLATIALKELTLLKNKIALLEITALWEVQSQLHVLPGHSPIHRTISSFKIAQPAQLASTAKEERSQLLIMHANKATSVQLDL